MADVHDSPYYFTISALNNKKADPNYYLAYMVALHYAGSNSDQWTPDYIFQEMLATLDKTDEERK